MMCTEKGGWKVAKFWQIFSIVADDFRGEVGDVPTLVELLDM